MNDGGWFPEPLLNAFATFPRAYVTSIVSRLHLESSESHVGLGSSHNEEICSVSYSRIALLQGMKLEGKKLRMRYLGSLQSCAHERSRKNNHHWSAGSSKTCLTAHDDGNFAQVVSEKERSAKLVVLRLLKPYFLFAR